MTTPIISSLAFGTLLDLHKSRIIIGHGYRQYVSVYFHGRAAETATIWVAIHSKYDKAN